MDNGNVKVSTYRGTATLSFHHPKSNSLTSKLLAEITEAINKLSVDKEVRVVVIRSEGEKTFSAGASLDELYKLSTF
jgi:methylglutaconyl-CoA hydratase